MDETGYATQQQTPGIYQIPGSAGYLQNQASGTASGVGPQQKQTAPQSFPSPYPQLMRVDLALVKKDHELQKCLDAMASKPQFKGMSFALADLTGITDGPVPVAAINYEKSTFVGSMAKLALVLPAFMLRDAARQVATQGLISNQAKFLAELAKAWSGEFQKGFRGGSAADTKPNLSRILEVSKNQKSGGVSINLTGNHNKELKLAGFRPRMVLALDASDNAAAALCIRDLGFPYIHEVHRRAGFGGTNGLQLHLDFGGKKWDNSMQGSGQAATARWLTELLVLIARGRLIAKNDDALDVLSDRYPDLASGISNFLSDTEAMLMSRKGKIGYLDKKPFADCAIIRRQTSKGIEIAYVAVALNGDSHERIREAGAELDDCILKVHGEPLKIGPVAP